LVFRRLPGAPEITHRELVDGWLGRLWASDLPLPQPEGTRPKSPLSFAAPLPVGMTAERELADLVLSERLPIADVRAQLASTLPAGIEVLELHDVWLGSPPLAASVAAADYRVECVARAPSAEIRAAVNELLAAGTLPRQRLRGSEPVSYDLRPLVDTITVERAEATADGSTTLVLLIRTRFHPERGSGRPEEVVAALGDLIPGGLDARQILRAAVLLAEEVAPIG
jgi:radical SAM-linked protein